MHWVTTLIMVIVWGSLGLLSESPDMMADLYLTDYLPPSIGGHALQV